MSDADDADDVESIREEKLQELAEQAGGNGEETAGGRPSEPLHVGSPEEFERLVNEHGLVLVDFHAEWCGPCQMMEPAIEAVAEDGPAAVLKVDIDQLQELAQQHGIRGVPTLEVYRDGERVEQAVGMKNEDGIRQLVGQYA
jgi:thioredoxin 1